MPAIQNICCHLQSKEEGNDQGSIQSTTLAQYIVWESDKNNRKHHKQESQEVDLFPTMDHKATGSIHGSMAKTKTNTNNKKDPQKKHRLGTVSKKKLEGLNLFHGTNLTLNSDVDQDT